MRVVTAAEMREIDRITTTKFGIPSLTLMENAGSAVAEFVLERFPGAKTIGVICGKGNNGGDGLVAARKLHEAGKRVKVLLLGDPKELKGDAAAMHRKLPIAAIAVRAERELEGKQAQAVYGCDVLIDAIFGTGFKAPAKGFYAEAIKMFAGWQAPIVAVDIPSGLESEMPREPEFQPHVPATAVVTFTAAKQRLVLDPELSSSEIVVAEIGSPDEAITSQLGLHVTTARDVVIPPRAPDSNKGNYGHVLVIAGSLGKAGAAAMAGIAALRAGAGLVTVATPRSALNTVASFAPELMTEPLEETAAGTISPSALETLEHLLRGKSVLALGPGLSTHPETVDLVRALVGNCRLPLVLDADGLNAFAGMMAKLDGAKLSQLVITPHPGEMARLLGCPVADVQNHRVEVARSVAQQQNAVVVLKGYRTLVAHPDGRVWANPTGNPAMAKGGSGDVLTGMIAGMMARDIWRQSGTVGVQVDDPRVAKALDSASKKKDAEKLSKGEKSAVETLRKGLEDAQSARAILPVIAAVYLHGLAGDIARDELEENSVLATDMIRCLPWAFRLVHERAREKFIRISSQ
ncbi:MAG TPA: NAD(P)H-hydrate dehydratase [Terriglobales bacterium]|nr:NAD(P)H-hydrate dehydratase [Terriglobales bacterium]